MENVEKKVSRHHLHYLYVIFDFLVTSIFVFISFLTFYWAQLESMNVLFVSLYSFGVGLVMILSFWIARIYKMLTRNYGFSEALYIALIAFVVMAAALIFILLYQAVSHYTFKRPSFWSWVLCTVCICACLPSLRLSSRLFRFIHNHFTKSDNKIITIVVGAGRNGKILLDESNTNVNSTHKIVAFVDDDPNLISSTLGRVPVYGPVSNIAQYIEQYKASEVVISATEISDERLKEIVSYMEFSNVRVRKMTNLNHMDGPNEKKVFDVDVNELLYRSNVILDNTSINDFVADKTVLVTGAGGSIGSELVRQIFKAKPKQLILFDIYENSTYAIEQELIGKMRKENINDISLITLIGSTYNEQRVEYILSTYKPDIIYHAAAYKHVPLMENSPAEAIRTNVIGTYNVARLADKYKVKKMILVSTDKAVRPTNTMGATKRFAEMVIQYYAEISKNTIYGAVRFGNVLGSNGSVIPLFKKQIESGGPVTITDKEIIRYFMTIPEAVSLILQCSLYAKEGEIFVLDMGKPIKIIELAEKMIHQAGLVPYKDIDIVTIGLRPGEKLYEELLLDPEKQTKTANDKIYIEPREKVKPIEEDIEKISKVFNLSNNKEIKKLLSEVVTTYQVKE